jgi:tetratricopeptide (TPR) repeat protein
MDSTVTNIVNEATRCANKGDFRGAARHYQKALAACPAGDRYTRGCLNIDLGLATEHVAAAITSPSERLGVLRDAVGYYTQASADLANIQGEAVLHRGRALMHLGRIYIDHDLPESVGYYREALRLFESYPYTSRPERVEARMALMVANASFPDTELNVTDLNSVWQEAQLTSSAEIHPSVVANFASLLLTIAHAEREHGVITMDIGGLEAWAGPELYRTAYGFYQVAHGLHGGS